MHPRDEENSRGGMRRPSAAEKLSMLTLTAAALGVGLPLSSEILLGTQFAGGKRKPVKPEPSCCLNCGTEKFSDLPFCSGDCCYAWKAKKKAERQAKKTKG
jgi:hypothetical protein